MKTFYVSSDIHKALKDYKKTKKIPGPFYLLTDEVIKAGMKALKIKK